MWVVIWGVLLTGFTLLMRWVKEETEVDILPLAFGMTAYTMGPLLAMFLCALLGRGRFPGLLVGSAISFLCVLFIRADIWALLHSMGMPYEWLGALPTYDVVGEGDSARLVRKVGFFWAWPATTVVTFLCGYFWPRAND